MRCGHSAARIKEGCIALCLGQQWGPKQSCLHMHCPGRLPTSPPLQRTAAVTS